MNVLTSLALLCSIALLVHAEDGIPQGRLGHLLGAYLTIEGVRAEFGKVGVQTLLVDTINGQKLDKPIGIWIDNVAALPEGERCVIKGYESGRMIGTPPAVLEVAKESGKDINLPQARWQFFRFFVMTSAVRPAGLTEHPEPISVTDHFRARREAMKKANGEPPAGGDGKPVPPP